MNNGQELTRLRAVETKTLQTLERAQVDLLRVLNELLEDIPDNPAPINFGGCTVLHWVETELKAYDKALREWSKATLEVENFENSL